jgi:hypothetical protein
MGVFGRRTISMGAVALMALGAGVARPDTAAHAAVPKVTTPPVVIPPVPVVAAPRVAIPSVTVTGPQVSPGGVTGPKVTATPAPSATPRRPAGSPPLPARTGTAPATTTPRRRSAGSGRTTGTSSRAPAARRRAVAPALTASAVPAPAGRTPSGAVARRASSTKRHHGEPGAAGPLHAAVAGLSASGRALADALRKVDPRLSDAVLAALAMALLLGLAGLLVLRRRAARLPAVDRGAGAAAAPERTPSWPAEAPTPIVVESPPDPLAHR